MRKHFALAALGAAILVTFSYARPGQQDQSKVVIQAEKTSPANGRQMYHNYCAPCHGRDGKGSGPVAPALRQAPTDLTVLSRDNNGKFPTSHVAAVLRFGSDHPAHGSVTMPIWGPLFASMDSHHTGLRQLRIANLCDYLKTIQVK